MSKPNCQNYQSKYIKDETFKVCVCVVGTFEALCYGHKQNACL